MLFHLIEWSVIVVPYYWASLINSWWKFMIISEKTRWWRAQNPCLKNVNSLWQNIVPHICPAFRKLIFSKSIEKVVRRKIFIFRTHSHLTLGCVSTGYANTPYTNRVTLTVHWKLMTIDEQNLFSEIKGGRSQIWIYVVAWDSDGVPAGWAKSVMLVVRLYNI